MTFSKAYHQRKWVLAVAFCLTLGGCETLQADLDRGYADLKTAFSSLGSSLGNSTETPPASAEQLKTVSKKPSPVGASTAETETTVAIAAAGGKTKSAASDNEPSKAVCPEVRIVQDLNQVHQFQDENKPDARDSVSTIRMTDVQEYCTIVKNSVAIDMNIAFDGELGPKARAKPNDKPSFAYPYFVAITNAQGSIIAKEVFAVTMAYEPGMTAETRTEQIRQTIPTTGGNPGGYRVLVGFQLSDQELAYNRSLPRDLSQIEPASGD